MRGYDYGLFLVFRVYLNPDNENAESDCPSWTIGARVFLSDNTRDEHTTPVIVEGRYSI